MTLSKAGRKKLIVVGAVAALFIFLSGCIFPNPNPKDEAPGGMSIPIPIQRNYIQDSAINSAKIEDGAIVSADIADGTIANVDITNGAVNNSQITNGAINGTQIITNAVNDTQLSPSAIFGNYTTNTTVSITGTTFINATSPGALVLNRTSLVAISYSTQLSSTGSAFMRLIIDGVEQSPGIVFMGNGTGNLPNNQALAGYAWINGSLLAGTHYYNVQVNVTAGTLSLANATLSGVAYPR